MNEQDIAAADTILLMEAEEKVKMRILQVVSDVIWGYQGTVLPSTYQNAVSEIHAQLRNRAREETRSLINTGLRITAN